MIYINDIFIMKKTKEEYKKRIRKTLEKLLIIGLRIKFSKSEFKKKEVKFLRHIVEQRDIKSDSEKVRILKK